MWSRRLLRRVQRYRQYSSYPENVVIELGPDAGRVILDEIVAHYVKAIKKALGVSVSPVDLVYYIERDPHTAVFTVRVTWAPQNQPGSAPDLDWMLLFPAKTYDNPPAKKVVIGKDRAVLRLDGWDEKNRRWIYRERKVA